MSAVKLLALVIVYVCVHFQSTLAQDFSPMQFNATGDGKTDDTSAVRAALAAAAAQDGGRVVFDANRTFLTGCFNVTSNIILDVRGTILASHSSNDYVEVEPLPWYGGGQDAQMKGKLEWQSVVRSYYASNITIMGGGIIDGQGKPWWDCAKEGLKNPPCNGVSRPQLVRFIHTTDIIIYNITLKDSPSWTLHFANCTNVHVHDMKIVAPSNSHNTDGFDIDCSVNVLIESSSYSGGDDAIAVKSGIDYLGRTFGRTTENVIVRNMTIGTSHGLSVGSEMSAGVRNVTFQDITVNGSANGARIKSQRGRGGTVEDITYSNIHLYDVDVAIYLTMNYNKNLNATNATATPKFNNVKITGLFSNEAKKGWFLDGLDESAIHNAYFSNIHIMNTKKIIEMCANIYGSCDNSTVSPYCPPCIQKENVSTPHFCQDNGKCFTVIIDQKLNWNDAEKYCERTFPNGRLASLHSAFDGSIISSWLSFLNTDPWFGAFKTGNLPFQYTDGSPLDYTNWAPGQPTLSCAQICRTTGNSGGVQCQQGKWRTADCASTTAQMICEY